NAGDDCGREGSIEQPTAERDGDAGGQDACNVVALGCRATLPEETGGGDQGGDEDESAAVDVVYDPGCCASASDDERGVGQECETGLEGAVVQDVLHEEGQEIPHRHEARASQEHDQITG